MPKIDDKDAKIIRVLRRNSRSAIRDIAKETGIRPSTVHQRMQKMAEEGIISQFTIKLDNSAADEGFIVFMFVTTNKDLPQAFFQDSHVKEAFGVTGEYDLLIKLKFKDIEEFNAYIINLRKRPEIAKTITTVVTINIKEEI